ncbi:hypothetical protein [Roseibacillus persicicus]|nr:hypothetical protein [Roseibacillus persicicus]
MKMTPKRLFAPLFCALGLMAQAAENPVGEISADAALVRAGAYPKLDWNIVYPTSVLEWISITPGGVIVPKSDLTMQVRVLAADVQSRKERWNGWRWTVTYTYISVTGYGRINNKSWRQLFNNTQPYVNPSAIVWQDELEEGDEVIFAAKANYDGGSWYYSGEGSDNVIVLKKGDYPPSYATWDTQSTLGTHIAPYLDESGAVDIGPRDVIVAFELTHQMRASGNSEGDMQDMIVLLTFQTEEG